MKDKKLSDEARKARNEYMKQYRKKNKEKMSEINKRYWERKAAKENEEV